MSSRDLDRLSGLQDLKNKQIKTSQAAENMRVSVRHAYRSIFTHTPFQKIGFLSCQILLKVI